MEEFGGCHEGIAGAVLDDGSEPRPVYLDFGSGADSGCWTSEWWAYNGQGRRPRAAGIRAACACGWRGETYPIDWERAGDDIEDVDTSGAYDDWCAHIAGVERQTVPLPGELTDMLDRLDKQLDQLAGQAPVAALKAVAALDRLARAAGRKAAYAAESDELSAEAIGKGLGVSAEKARSRLCRYLIG
ncbi:hypothetical protein [Streptomyces sp. NPDC015131]|uniref:hypothetical protein n=1 Tax=Streptomyces sp. NPDC015131 TaxID=3364941 RepID=UPI0037004F57